MNRPFRRLLLGLLTFALAGCANVQRSQRDALLASEAHSYTAAIRWGELDAANKYLRTREGLVPKLDSRRYRGVKVTDYQYRLEATGTPGETLMNARFTYYRENSARLRTLDTQGLWWYDEKSGAWFLEGAPPDFGP